MRLTARMARPHDARAIWEWRNDPVTRQNSLRTEPIAWKDHCEWFRQHLASPTTRLYVVEDQGGRPVAQVRYERLNHDLADVHITVAPGDRGRGVGTEALRMTMPLAVHSLQVRRVAAAIKKRNEASLRAFLRVGFRLEERGLGDARCETVEESGFDSRCQVLYFDILTESVPQP